MGTLFISVKPSSFSISFLLDCCHVMHRGLLSRKHYLASSPLPQALGLSDYKPPIFHSLIFSVSFKFFLLSIHSSLASNLQCFYTIQSPEHCTIFQKTFSLVREVKDIGWNNVLEMRLRNCFKRNKSNDFTFIV